MSALRIARNVCAALLVTVAVARALPAGTLYITDKALDPKSATFEKDLKKEARTTLKKNGDGWHLYFVAYMKKAAGAEEVNIVFYELGAGNKREQVNAYPIGTQATAKIIMSDIEISAEQGFAAGKRYQILITRLVGGKEDVYARATLQLQ